MKKDISWIVSLGIHVSFCSGDSIKLATDATMKNTKPITLKSVSNRLSQYVRLFKYCLSHKKDCISRYRKQTAAIISILGMIGALSGALIVRGRALTVSERILKSYFQKIDLLYTALSQEKNKDEKKEITLLALKVSKDLAEEVMVQYDRGNLSFEDAVSLLKDQLLTAQQAEEILKGG